ncbi:MAG TPA: hypothetical protein VJP80_02910 [Candidatus Saccharimonadales bacterium]|nr:hypothetical protein [Candidatus Saccharimonadales bacterium]
MREIPGFSGVHMEYADVPPEARYTGAQEAQFEQYLTALADPTELTRQLDQDFVRVDGVLVLRDGEPPVVQHVVAVPGREAFLGFRAMVGRQTEPHGEIEGAWVPADDYEHIRRQVIAQLPEGINGLPGELIAAGAVSLPAVLRPPSEGGVPLDLPPPLHPLLEPGEQPFEPLVATGDPQRDYHEVHVVEAIFGDERSIIARVGLVWDDERAVPLAINQQITALRAGEPLPRGMWPIEVAEHLQRYAEGQTGL